MVTFCRVPKSGHPMSGLPEEEVPFPFPKVGGARRPTHAANSVECLTTCSSLVMLAQPRNLPIHLSIVSSASCTSVTPLVNLLTTLRKIWTGDEGGGRSSPAVLPPPCAATAVVAGAAPLALRPWRRCRRWRRWRAWPSSIAASAPDRSLAVVVAGAVSGDAAASRTLRFRPRPPVVSRHRISAVSSACVSPRAAAAVAFPAPASPISSMWKLVLITSLLPRESPCSTFGNCRLMSNANRSRRCAATMCPERASTSTSRRTAWCESSSS